METGLEYKEIVFNVSNAKEFSNTLLVPGMRLNYSSVTFHSSLKWKKSNAWAAWFFPI